MNNSSVIFVGGFTIVFGFFAAQSFNADARALRTADARASQLQADLIASSGVYIAAYHMSSPAVEGSSVTDRPVNGGTLSFVITVLSSSSVRVVSTGTVLGVSVTKTAMLSKGVSGSGTLSSWAQWNVSKIYTQPYSLSDVIIE